MRGMPIIINLRRPDVGLEISHLLNESREFKGFSRFYILSGGGRATITYNKTTIILLPLIPASKRGPPKFTKLKAADYLIYIFLSLHKIIELCFQRNKKIILFHEPLSFMMMYILSKLFKLIPVYRIIKFYSETSSNPLLKGLELLAIRSSIVLVLNDECAKAAKSKGAKKIFILKWLPNLTPFLNALPIRLNVPSPILLYAGRLAEEKGLMYLLEAVKILKRKWNFNGCLILVGDGYLRNKLVEKAEKLSLIYGKNLVITGWVARSMVARYIASCDVFILPSLSETQANVILEAMACGKPIVATNVYGPKNWIQDGVTGILVPPRDPKSLAYAIKKALNNSNLGVRAKHYLLNKIKGLSGLQEEIDVRDLIVE